MKQFLKSRLLAGAMATVLAVVAAGCGNQQSNTTSSTPAANSEGASSSPSTTQTDGVIKIATKPMTEQFIISEMLGLLIEQDTGLKVEITKGIGGGTSNIHPALVKGEFDLYPEYTSTGWLMVLKKDKLPDEAELFDALQKEYQEQFGLKWVGQYGYNNTYTLAVRTDVAQEHQLKTFSDLIAAAPSLVFGGNADFIEREDGFYALCDAYGLSFKEVMDIDIGLKYQALASKEIDLTNAYTTDAQLGVADVVTLEDDKGFFTNYYASTVVRADTLEKYPELESTLMKMDGILSDKEMSQLNYQVEVEGKDEKEVAREFLISKNLLNQ